jgi:uncharacterized protein YegP (UPF0339 family)
MLQRMGVALGTVLVLWLAGTDVDGPLSARRAAAQADAGKLKFEVYKDASKEYRWRLKGSDDKLLATAGQGFNAKADCRKSVDGMMTKLEKRKFEVYQDKGQHFRWRLIASNGQVVAASSGAYATKGDCEKAIDVVKKGAPKAEVSEPTAK